MITIKCTKSEKEDLINILEHANYCMIADDCAEVGTADCRKCLNMNINWEIDNG